MRGVWPLVALLVGCRPAVPDEPVAASEANATDGTPDGGPASGSSDGGPAMVYTPDQPGMLAFIEDACVSCHADGLSAGALPLPVALEDDLATGAGALVVPFDPGGSALWRVVSGQLAPGDLDVMPLGAALPPEYVAHVEVWIADGAPWTFAIVDGDEDGFAAEDDCDDTDPSVNPGAVETCDGVDEDCDGAVDPDTSVDAEAWYPDGDGDGYGDGTPTYACTAPSGHVALAGDCDDTDASFHPGAPETDCADPNDYNCDGSTGATDADLDGWAACIECDDADAANFPGADEWCDAVDNDCDGVVDEGDALDAVIWYADADGDGHGDPLATTRACAAPVGHVAVADDCDDTDGLVYPGADEVCDGQDQDCDGTVDEDAVDAPAWYPDADGDGYGDAAASPVSSCGAVPGHVDNADDCDDLDATVHPGQLSDPTDGIDNDCDGAIDEDAFTWTHSADVQPIWDAECTSCHGGIAPSGDLSLEGNAWAAIVDVPSGDVPTMDLIEPGDPASSYLWHKLVNTHLAVGGSGSSMPKGGALVQSDLDLIETWILEGAPP